MTPPDRRIAARDFERLVARAVEALPERFRPYLENVAVIIEPRPSRQLARELELEPDEALYGLYEGTPLVERGGAEPLWPDRIIIFREPLLEEFGDDPEEVVRQVGLTVRHEVGHHFGLEEAALEQHEDEEAEGVDGAGEAAPAAPRRDGR